MTDSTDIQQLPSMDAQPSQQLVQPQQYNPNTPDVQNGPIQSSQTQGQLQGPLQGQPQPQAPVSQPHVPPSEPLSQEVIQQLIEGVQKASSTGATKLPSRDIPQDTTGVTMDEHQHPNHVPGHGPNAPSSIHNQDYIQQYDTMESMLAERKQRDTKETRLNQLYEEIQTPVLVVVLFFLFQLPFVHKTFQKYLPNLWVEGKPSLGAYLVQASAFGATYYGLRYMIQMVSEPMN